MNFLQKISSKFGLLTSQRTLVLAISEERQVHETILKLVLARVNASTSFLRWAKMEQDEVLKTSVSQLYDISLMYASVQREFAEQSNSASTALKDILACEVALEQLQKKLREVTEKKERLRKNESDATKRRTSEDISKLKDEEEALKKELDTKTMQAEDFKCKSLKNSLATVCNAHLKYAEKISLIFTAAQKIIDNIKDVPDHTKPQRPQPQRTNGGNESEVLVELSKALNINRPISSKMPTPSSKFHVDLEQKKAEIKKTISNPVLLSPPGRPTRNIQRDETADENVASNPPAPVVPGHRRRSNTNTTSWCEKKSISSELSSIISHHEYDVVEYNGGKLHRSSSESTILKASEGDYGYCQPWENFQADQEEAMIALNNELGEALGKSDRSASEPVEYETFYADPADMFDQGIYESNEDYTKYPEYKITCPAFKQEQIYMEPHEGNISGNSNSLPSRGFQNIYRNTADNYLFENVEYIDNNIIQEPIRSKLDLLENIVLTKNSQSPSPKPRPKVDISPGRKLLSQSVKLPGDKGLKKIPPKPAPRPDTVLYENTSTLIKNTLEYKSADCLDNIPLRGAGSVRELAAQMSSKIQPACLVPSMTQAKLDEQESPLYGNL